jgi:formylglycine-generating enzyme required for sulfatase activity
MIVQTPPADPLGEALLLEWHRQGRPVPAGLYRVGTQESLFRNPDREVHLSPFEISEHEVTNGEYRRFVEAGGYERREYWSTAGWGAVDLYVEEDTGRSGPAFWTDGGFPEGEEDHPVVGISFDEAAAYCAWLGSVHPDLSGARLPTEDEWEVAASSVGDGGEGRDYPWGDEWDPRKANIGSGRAHAVESFSNDSSHLGCRDMAGNVREWATGSLEGCLGRPVIRGGCFLEGMASPESLARSESRLAPRDEGFRRRRWSYTGFRVVVPGGPAGGPRPGKDGTERK